MRLEMMEREKRAKQFAPFDALTGLREAIRLKEYAEQEELRKYLSFAAECWLDKAYSEDELVAKIREELDKELEKEISLSRYDEDDIIEDFEVNIESDGITLKLIYEVLEEIGIEEKIN